MGLDETAFASFDQLADLIEEDLTWVPTRRVVPEMETKKRELLLKRRNELDAIYFESWRPAHQAICEFVDPYAGQFWSGVDENKGWQRDQQIVNDTAGESHRKLTSAIDTAITSEARVWHTYGSDDPKDMENPANAAYCHDVQLAMFSMLSASNFYPTNRNVLDDTASVATGVLLIDPDPVTVFRFTHLPPGSFRLGVDASGEPNRLVREWTITAAQMVEEFGIERCSVAVQNATTNEQIQTEYRICQIIEPRVHRDPNKKDAKSKPWASYWFEIGSAAQMTGGIPGAAQNSQSGDGTAMGLLRESGYDVQPFAVSYWNKKGLDAYGMKSPGWNALGATMAVQVLELEVATNIARIGTPPLGVPDEIRNASLLPGAITRLPPGANNAKVEALIDLKPEAITVIDAKIEKICQAIINAFFGNVLFLISNGGQGQQPATATEINAKKAEQLLQLGGMFSRVSRYLKTAMAAAFHYAQLAGKLPPPPPVLAKKGKISVTFQNSLVSAQRATEFSSIQQAVAASQAAATARTAGVDTWDWDEHDREVNRMFGLNPKLMLDPDTLAQNRQAKAQAAQAQAQSAALQAGAGAVKDISASDPDRLQQMLQRFGPYAQSQGAGVGGMQ